MPASPFPKQIQIDFPEVEIIRLLSESTPESEDIITWANKLFHEVIIGHSADEAMNASINYSILIMKIGDLAQKCPNRKGADAVMHVLLRAIVKIITSRYEPDEKMMEVLAPVLDITHAFRSDSRGIPTLMLANAFNEMILLKKFVASLVAENGNDFLRLVGTSDLSEQSKVLMQQILELQKYGIKSVLATDGFSHGKRRGWVLRDSRQIRELMMSEQHHGLPHRAHRVIMTMENVAPDEVSTLALTTNRGATHDHVMMIERPYDITAQLHLTETGELQNSLLFETDGVRNLFAKHGERGERTYDLLRYAHILHLFDLVVPATMIDRLPPLRRQSLIDAAKNLSHHSLASNLTLPRIRLLDRPRELLQALEEEAERADEETVKRVRNLARHEVTWHVRRLPAGRKPSPQAKELAARLNIPLGDHETIVKPHFRGSGPEMQLHTTKLR